MMTQTDCVDSCGNNTYVAERRGSVSLRKFLMSVADTQSTSFWVARKTSPGLLTAVLVWAMLQE